MTRHCSWLLTCVLFAAVGCGDDDGQANDNNVNNNNGVGICGDGVLDTGEACDDGASNSDSEPDGCRTDCRAFYCGDGVIDSDEICEPEDLNGETCESQDLDGGTLACSTDCTYDLSGCFGCGNGLLETSLGEVCDGSEVGTHTCLDDSAFQSGNIGCTTECALETSQCYTCGDSQQNGPEVCDDGTNDGSYDGCMAGCLALGPFCGDGALQGGAGEDCDNGTNNSDTLPNACRMDCTDPICGDGVTDDAAPNSEACDDAAANSDATPNACREDCSLPVCGDGVVDDASPFDETCDDGIDNGDYGYCASNCAGPGDHCGDGVQNGGEMCDGSDGVKSCTELDYPGDQDGLCDGSCEHDPSPCVTCDAWTVVGVDVNGDSGISGTTADLQMLEYRVAADYSVIEFRVTTHEGYDRDYVTAGVILHSDPAKSKIKLQNYGGSVQGWYWDAGIPSWTPMPDTTGITMDESGVAGGGAVVFTLPVDFLETYNLFDNGQPFSFYLSAFLWHNNIFEDYLPADPEVIAIDYSKRKDCSFSASDNADPHDDGATAGGTWADFAAVATNTTDTAMVKLEMFFYEVVNFQGVGGSTGDQNGLYILLANVTDGTWGRIWIQNGVFSDFIYSTDGTSYTNSGTQPIIYDHGELNDPGTDHLVLDLDRASFAAVTNGVFDLDPTDEIRWALKSSLSPDGSNYTDDDRFPDGWVVDANAGDMMLLAAP